MSRYAIKIIVRNLDREGGDDTDDLIVRAEIISDSAEDAANLNGTFVSKEVIGPELHSVSVSARRRFEELHFDPERDLH